MLHRVRFGRSRYRIVVLHIVNPQVIGWYGAVIDHCHGMRCISQIGPVEQHGSTCESSVVEATVAVVLQSIQRQNFRQ